MENKVDVKKTVFNKAQYQKTIDTGFNELGVTNITEDIESTLTVEKFFENYNEIFYEIPATGETNSHEYLVKTSGEYINFDENSEIIQALQEEINALREQNLELEMEKVKLLTGENISLTTNIDDQTKSDSTTDVLNTIGAGGLSGIGGVSGGGGGY
ncbi:hypothetical protein N8579_00915 [bacterium]|jgi:hypothetical protein|nr:hypothetical protein [bacterium]